MHYEQKIPTNVLALVHEYDVWTKAPGTTMLAINTGTLDSIFCRHVKYAKRTSQSGFKYWIQINLTLYIKRRFISPVYQGHGNDIEYL